MRSQPTPRARPRPRDATASRDAILAAAEALFAERGFRGASLEEIAVAAGRSRATPSYFYGSKDGLYRAVLERVLADRERALAAAFAPLREWPSGHPDALPELRAAVEHGVRGYADFLVGRPSFARLMGWESLEGGSRLAPTMGRSTAIVAALRAVRDRADEHGLAPFDPQQVLVALVSLCFLPVAHHATFRAGGGIDTLAAEFLDPYCDRVVDLVLALLTTSG
jgi:AcrR family transcriptional regulator